MSQTCYTTPVLQVSYTMSSASVPSDSSLTVSVATTPSNAQSQPAQQRRIGRVECWLNKGYGFIIDLGEVQISTDTPSYGWKSDSISGNKVFVYHNALVSQSEQVFHRLFAHEYVEYTLDPSRPTRDGRYQAFNVTGLQRQLLLCDLNANDDSRGVPQNKSSSSRRQPQPQPTPQIPGLPPGATVIYYVPQPAAGPLVPQQTSEPSYLMPMSGIPVPK